ncbi:AGE family epimerase/isomerase [Microbulbifer harenosus]|uniref:Mannose-6-phosphate isomerase n=1 Tax=Microbulbifer harenosus TaxID=2576840 RepID=A0ABY2UEU4_9GAMM|nr:AGE family epimerase/isomerase [Microbulbifer harenosus]TLM75253.1 mannose-6-phosphate isomerase [Microbulbifer harenosus]
MLNDLTKWADHLTHWMSRSALPLWLEQGFDAETGSAHERLDDKGHADLACPKRVRVQARQMFVLASAQQRGWITDGAARVERLDTFTSRFATHPQAPDVFVHVLSADNEISDARQDVYDMAFFLLACAWRFRAFGDASALRKADALTRHLDNYIKGPRGGWLEGDYDSKARRQNPHMHLFEAFIALYDATRDGRWLARAGEIFTLFENCFYDAEHGVLLEYFHQDWRPLSGDEGQEVEPGHMLEWVWLLHQYHHRSGAPVRRYTDRLYQSAIDHGLESHTGLLYDAIALDGTPLKTTKRCWPLTELIKASLCQAEAGSELAETQAARAIQTLFKYYFSNEIPGLYIDQLDGANQILNGKAPASTLYHLMVATTEAADYAAAKRLKLRAEHVPAPSAHLSSNSL